ncbi:MAG: glycosyltransferase, partial [Candidatus Kapaibacterium sp.]
KIENIMQGISEVDFVFLPQVSQETILELYKKSSAVVMTPLSDGSPVSAMEAMACGANVILGPIQYDSQIFNTNVIKLLDWDAEKLAHLITKATNQEHKVDVRSMDAIIDRTTEMKKLDYIYGMLLEKNK